MSLIPLDTAKSFLDVIHDWDDAKLQLLLDAEDEACQFMWRQSLDGLCNCEESSEAVSEPGLPPAWSSECFCYFRPAIRLLPMKSRRCVRRPR